ncbi:hypothetical protein KIN20_023266 [Parelaphostrongylus tenuis]|uniref:Uncharacterized protein n=1 Tax=Parelaphostrongylus tenuis TaxID=148309 RepID=A0AAD5N8V8_PARTN|nr:hypothetical protein KIN20_023266 [Parelaphostrongylus tenuis]
MCRDVGHKESKKSIDRQEEESIGKKDTNLVKRVPGDMPEESESDLAEQYTHTETNTTTFDLLLPTKLYRLFPCFHLFLILIHSLFLILAFCQHKSFPIP